MSSFLAVEAETGLGRACGFGQSWFLFRLPERTVLSDVRELSTLEAALGARSHRSQRSRHDVAGERSEPLSRRREKARRLT